MKKLRMMSYDISRKLSNIPKSIEQAVDTTANEILEEVVANANYKNGDFVASIYKEPTTNNGEKVASFIGSNLTVSSSSGNVYNLGYLLENGTRAHEIYPVNKNYLAFQVNGEWVFTKHVSHPGTQPYLFYYNALHSATPRLGMRISKAIKEELNK
jgi:hypothetical protein